MNGKLDVGEALKKGIDLGALAQTQSDRYVQLVEMRKLSLLVHQSPLFHMIDISNKLKFSITGSAPWYAVILLGLPLDTPLLAKFPHIINNFGSQLLSIQLRNNFRRPNRVLG